MNRHLFPQSYWRYPCTSDTCPFNACFSCHGVILMDCSVGRAGGAGVAGVPLNQDPPMELNPAAAGVAATAAPPVVREQDRFMPIANVIRIMRRVLPAHAKIADDAKEMIQECVSEYISFITSEANERCQREQRKTVTAEDVLWAMNKLGFDDYIEPLTLYLHRYRELEGDHRGSVRGEALQLIKHRAVPTAVPDMTTPVSQFFTTAPVPPPNYAMPPPATAAPQHLNLLSESMVSYFLGMYGGGEGSSASGSYSHVNGMPNFDHPYPPYK
ncbi:hypothetical protein OPV22_011515 [Ensete ventricosum]|uniref:Transcription factor CBF/NF-Y/archaeal histone domain-containing protein n=1 Tax=Ensete ventricosum TaxID=4639 RepID=A0AAV8R9V7_ENSVE|nr:hypothetical protein OPV22_011515 [Ensete ventricosum]